jgi:hypothetical protein
MKPLNRGEINRNFRRAVNMTAAEIDDWLGTEESRAVGYKAGDEPDQESVGHASGRRIVAILRTKKELLTDADYAHMRKVIGFVRRHSAQRPENIYTSRWRYSLMNWGHDPLRNDQP